MVPPFSNGESLEEDEALSVDQFFAQDTEEGAELLELEVLPRDPRQRRAACEEGICGGGDLLDLGGGEDVCPLFGVGCIY